MKLKKNAEAYKDIVANRFKQGLAQGYKDIMLKAGVSQANINSLYESRSKSNGQPNSNQYVKTIKQSVTPNLV